MEGNREHIQRLAYQVLDDLVNEKWMALQSSAAELADAVWSAHKDDLKSARTPMLSCPCCGSTSFFEEGDGNYCAQVCWPVDQEMIDLISDADTPRCFIHLEGTVGRREIIDLHGDWSYRCTACDATYDQPLDLAVPATASK